MDHRHCTCGRRWTTNNGDPDNCPSCNPAAGVARDDIVLHLRESGAVPGSYGEALRMAAAEEIERLRAALDIARTALLNIERKSEEARANLTHVTATPSR